MLTLIVTVYLIVNTSNGPDAQTVMFCQLAAQSPSSPSLLSLSLLQFFLFCTAVFIYFDESIYTDNCCHLYFFFFCFFFTIWSLYEVGNSLFYCSCSVEENNSSISLSSLDFGSAEMPPTASVSHLFLCC